MLLHRPIERRRKRRMCEGTPNPIGLFACNSGKPAPATRGLRLPPRRSSSTPRLPPQCTAPQPCATAAAKTPTFDGASGDGRRSRFTTSSPCCQLRHRRPTRSLCRRAQSRRRTRKAGPRLRRKKRRPTIPPGNGIDVGEDGWSANQGVVRISADGTHAAFVSPRCSHQNPTPSVSPLPACQQPLRLRRQHRKDQICYRALFGFRTLRHRTGSRIGQLIRQRALRKQLNPYPILSVRPRPPASTTRIGAANSAFGRGSGGATMTPDGTFCFFALAWDGLRGITRGQLGGHLPLRLRNGRTGPDFAWSPWQ